ncbi:MAG: hypothetical protein AAF222_13900 [Pseudomonadota bacterium]
MTLHVQIDGFRCNEETDGLGSDEIVFLLFGVPIGTGGRGELLARQDRELHKRVRWKEDVDTGEHHDFEHAIQVTQDNSARYLLMYHLIWEVDGAASTASQAHELESMFAGRLASRIALDDGFNLVQSPEVPFLAVEQTTLSGKNPDLLAKDFWFVDVQQPERGSLEVGPQLSTIVGSNAPAGNLTDDVYRGPLAGGGLIETRSYLNDSEDSRYTFDVTYRDAA